jgi:subtilase family serine protease
MANLANGVDTAVTQGATAVSNSYGGSEFSTETTVQSHYNHPGIAITASAGDSGYGVEFPAASQYVTAVGGTSLAKASNGRGWTEAAWAGAGSGCSRYVTAPSWQSAIGSCSKRTVADVSAVADPTTGIAVYDSYGSSRSGNWYVFGGTSASSPIIAGVYALANAAGKGSFTYGELPYARRSSLFDVTSGKNGFCQTSIKALCTAVGGYDGPTGLGTPNGITAF